MTYVLPRVELGATLAHEDVAWYDVLIWKALLLARCAGNEAEWASHIPENFLTPNRLPGEPPWLETVPPARFVAVRTDPSPVAEDRGLSVSVRDGQYKGIPMGENGLLAA